VEEHLMATDLTSRRLSLKDGSENVASDVLDGAEQLFLSDGSEILASDVIDGVEVVRTRNGWFYRDDEIRVPGAVDRTLASEFKPRFIRSADDQPEQVVVDVSAIDTHPEALGWCKETEALLQAMPDGTITAYVVPFDAWEAHAAKPLGMMAPEFSSNDAEAALARVERGFRLVRRSFDQAAQNRLDGLRAAIADGITRSRAAEILEISAARVTQLLSVPEMKLTAPEAAIVELATESPVTAADVAEAGKTISYVTTKIKAARSQLQSLEAKGVLASGAAGHELTDLGVQLARQLKERADKKGKQAKAPKAPTPEPVASNHDDALQGAQ
jgi:hypothetical protein